MKETLRLTILDEARPVVRVSVARGSPAVTVTHQDNRLDRPNAGQAADIAPAWQQARAKRAVRPFLHGPEHEYAGSAGLIEGPLLALLHERRA
jgi:hypothetical protein